MPSVQKLSGNIKPFHLHSSKGRPFKCYIDVGLTLELYAMLKMKICKGTSINQENELGVRQYLLF